VCSQGGAASSDVYITSESSHPGAAGRSKLRCEGEPIEVRHQTGGGDTRGRTGRRRAGGSALIRRPRVLRERETRQRQRKLEPVTRSLPKHTRSAERPETERCSAERLTPLDKLHIVARRANNMRHGRQRRTLSSRRLASICFISKESPTPESEIRQNDSEQDDEADGRDRAPPSPAGRQATAATAAPHRGERDGALPRGAWHHEGSAEAGSVRAGTPRSATLLAPLVAGRQGGRVRAGSEGHDHRREAGGGSGGRHCARRAPSS